MEIPVRNIVFLQGIFFSEIQTIEERMVETRRATNDASTNLASPYIQEARITQYKNKKQWIETYKDQILKCWYCNFDFRNLPCFIPRQIRNTQHGKVYDTHGLFCGFACAFTFLRQHAEFIRDKSYVDKLTMLKMLFTQFYNKRVIEFKEVPSVYDLTIYGGSVDITDYRNTLRTINASIIAEALPI